MTGTLQVDDPFGLRSLDIEALRAKRGAKWQHSSSRYAAWIADMDFAVAPAIRDHLGAVIVGDEFGYPNWGGPGAHSPAVAAFIDRMISRYDWRPNVDRLHEMNDVIQGVRVAIQHLSEPGDGVVLHLPAYHPFLDTIGAMDRLLVPIMANGREFDYDELERRLSEASAAVWILCHPHNPLGRVFGRSELERIADIAARHDITVISDEIHADLTYPTKTGEPVGHVPFETLGADVAARTVTVTSASKAFNLAGLRWAILHAGSDRLNAVLRALPAHYLGAPNVMAVEATVAGWTHGDGWLDAVIEVLAENRTALGGLLERYLPGTGYTPPDATYLAWLDVSDLGLGDDPARVFGERGVELSAGTLFGPPGAGHVRINLATSPHVLEATVQAMAG